MTSASLIGEMTAQIDGVESRILKSFKEVPFTLFLEWRSCRQKLGEHLVDEAFRFIANKYEAFILANPVNPSSFAHFTDADVQSKLFSIRERTIRSGMRNGFLDCATGQFGKSPLRFSIKGKSFFGVMRDTQEVLVQEASGEDEPLQAACYEDGSLIVSDVDLISINFKQAAGDVTFDPLYGQSTGQELLMIKELNFQFLQLLAGTGAQAATAFRLVSHGPANRFSGSKAAHIHYPLKVYSPAGCVELLGDEACREQSTEALLRFYSALSTSGYQVALNPKWEF